MKNTIVNYLNRLKKDRSRQRKIGAVLVCLSLVVAVGVTWSLHMTGESQTAETWCGYTEHQHSEECTEKVLVCGYAAEGTTESEQASAHTHTDECYETQTVLTCGETEHTHSAENGCYDEDGELICQIPEHTHSEENGCYAAESALICGMEEGSAEPAESRMEVSGHVHTDECYETIYMCGKEEHQHTLSCFSNPEADVETAGDWEKTFADVELTGVYADDLLAIAKTQLGYVESTDNYQVVLDEAGNETEEVKGYTRYGAWYGMPYEDWCAMFVSFCLNYAEVPEEVFPQEADCEGWVETLYDPEAGFELYEAAEDYIPCPGDLVFFDTNEDEIADHVGIVSELTPEYTGAEESYKDDPEYTLTGFKTIEGNSENKVKENKYELTDGTILGYGRLPENPELTGAEAGEETRTITADAGDGVTVAAVGKIPEGAYLTAQKLTEDQIACLGEAFADISVGEDSFAYDIKILSADGEELELGRNIRITISGLGIAGNAEISGYHLKDVDEDSLADANAENTAVEELDVSAGEDGITFVTNGFSVMLFSSNPEEEPTQINDFEIVFSSGGKATDMDGDGTISSGDYYVWEPTDSAAGHEFVYRADYTTSGHEIEEKEFVLTLPLHMLKDEDGNWADSFDCAYLREDEVGAGGSASFVYRIDEENNCVYIYNYSKIPAGQSGYIEFSYTTTNTTFCYEDMGEQPQMEARLDIGTAVDELTENPGTRAEANKDASTAGINIDTSVEIDSTSKQTPTRYTSWQSGWGDKPEDAGDYYYFVWPVYTKINKGTKRYDLTLTDTFSDFEGSVVAYRFSGTDEWVTPDKNTVTGLETSGSRYDYVLVRCSKAEILAYLKEQYPDYLKDINTLEDAEEALFNSGKYTLRYTIQNKVDVTVHPSDKEDDSEDTSASATKSYTYEVLPYENPVGIFYAEKWGIYHSSSRVSNSDDISSYKLSEFLKGTYQTLSGLKYYTYVDGYPGLYTLKDGAKGTAQEASEGGYYFQKSVTYSLADRDFSLRALTYESDYTTEDGKSISGVSQKLDPGDYDVTSLEWSATIRTATYSKDDHTWNASTMTSFLTPYEPEEGFEQYTLYFYVYAVPEGETEGQWILAATYNLTNRKYDTTDDTGNEYKGAKYIDKSSASGAGGTITFNSGVKGYKIEMSNPFYYTIIEAYPTITLKRNEHVARILLGSSAAVDDLKELANQVLSKIAVTNSSTGTVNQGGTTLFSRSPSGTDYVSAVVRNAKLSKTVSSTLNNKRNRQYEITWKVALEETYTDDTGLHNVPQESGTFYDLLPAGGILDLSSVKVSCSSGTLTAGAYDLEEIDNYNGTGRTMLKITIHEETSTSYNLTYTTCHTWDAIKDYGKKVLNSVAYETGNEDIGDGGADDGGGEISERNLMQHLTDTTDDDEDAAKFLFDEASCSISNLMAANTGLMKQVKASSDAAYSYSTVVSAGGTYSYQIRFANDSTTASDNIMLFDSLEYFHTDYVGDEGTQGNPYVLSDWEGYLTGIDTSQLDTKFTEGYTVYVSETDNLNFYQLNGTDATNGEPGYLGKDYDFKETDTETEIKANWVELSEYMTLHGGDLSGVHAIAIDARGNRLAAGDSITYTLYMQAPDTADDLDWEENGEPYPDPVTYNNIYVSRTALDVDYDQEGVGTVVESSAKDNFFHQDYTQLRFRPVTDVLLLKVSEADTTKRVSGATYVLSGISDYGTEYSEKVTSDKNGLITFSNIELGTYTLEETSCGSDWLQNREIYTVTVGYDEDKKLTVTLSGSDFPDFDGDGQWDMEEVNGIPRYLLTDEPRIHASLTFSKTDSVTGGPVAGAEFTLYGESDYGTDVLLYATADSSGRVRLGDVEKGTYTLAETVTPEGYIQPTTVWKVTVDASGARITTADGQAVTTGDSGYQLSNEPYHQIQFLKKSTYGKDNYIGGVVFTLTGTSDYGTGVNMTATSNGSYYGLVTFGGLEAGTYVLTETDTSGAADSSGLTYEPDSRQYQVILKPDGEYTIVGLSVETINIGTADEPDYEDFYVFPNTPGSGVVTVKKIWLDDVDDADRKPDDMDITIRTDEPDAASYGGTVITFTDEKYGGEFSNGSDTRKVTYVVSNGTASAVGRTGYETPTLDGCTFEGWYTDANREAKTKVTLNEQGYPMDSEGNLITPESAAGARLWTTVENDNGTIGYKLTLYAYYTANYNMKYAVRLYGIRTDVDANDQKLGLTFGPATGERYLYLGTDVNRNNAAEYGTSSGYVAHISKADYKAGNGVCLHWMTWEEIAEQSKKDPTVFQTCLESGCTHSVKVTLNETLKNSNSKYLVNMMNITGDGAGMFRCSIEVGYTKWNTSSTDGGWAYSRLRYNLNGVENCSVPDDDSKLIYSGDTYICDGNTSLISCFESGLQDAIVEAKKINSTGYSKNNDLYDKDGIFTVDKLWLFSAYELGASDDTALDNSATKEYRVRYTELRGLISYQAYWGNACGWLTRSEYDGRIFYVSNSGLSIQNNPIPSEAFDSSDSYAGVAPGFCIG